MSRRPNVVICISDQQRADTMPGDRRLPVRTPHLDWLAERGTLFRRAFCSTPMCSPARSSILTGLYPHATGLVANHQEREISREISLSPQVRILADYLQEAGYACAYTGKWHLGLAEGSRPSEHGFDKTFGFMAGCIDFFSHIFYWGANRPGPSMNPTHDLWENNEEIWRNGEYFTELIAKKAIEYIREMSKSDKPFFLYVPFNAPHYPMHAPQEYMDRFDDLPWDRQVMAAMISAVDDAIAKIKDELERLSLTDNTLSVFTSDNGPSRESRNWLDGSQDPYYGGTSGGLKGHKFSLFDGGVKEPAIMHWPARIPAGQVSTQSCASMDIVPTVLEAIGVDASQYEIDGTSILSHVSDGEDLEERAIFWEMDGQTAVRRGKWKLVINGQLVEATEPVAAVHLSDVESDPSESVNLVDSEPEIAAELKKLAEDWRAGIVKRWEEQYAGVDHEYVAHGMV